MNHDAIQKSRGAERKPVSTAVRKAGRRKAWEAKVMAAQTRQGCRALGLAFMIVAVLLWVSFNVIPLASPKEMVRASLEHGTQRETSRSAEPRMDSAADPLATTRGEPINTVTQGNPADTNIPGPITSPRKKRPRPASFQRRLVATNLEQPSGSNSDPAQTFGGTPAKQIYNPAQLAALPERPIPPSYQRVSFDTLAAFPFALSKNLVEGNLPAASAATLEKIPSDVRALDNHLVAVRGFLLPLRTNNGLTSEFLLMRNQNMCCFGTVPKINEWISVRLKGEGVKPVMDQPITVLGKLHVGDIRENGFLVGIYQLQAESVDISPGS